MTFSPILVGVVLAVMLGLTVLFAYTMSRRQQDTLRHEKKPVPSRALIFVAGLLTVLMYMCAILSAMLMLVAPFINLDLTGSIDGTTTLLIIVTIVLAAVGTGLYWLFVRLGLFSWRSFSQDN